MACPAGGRARNVGEFWGNVRDGVDCVSRFSAEELEAPDAAALAGRPDYVTARSVVDGADLFDAAFFGVLPREAELMDPQHRVFLECCWEALEDAGYDPQAFAGAIGVFAGCAQNTYFLNNLCADRGAVEDYVGAYPLGNYATMLGALADCLATRVSYKLNLRGPSLTIQTACSTSLVAVCQACQSLLTYQSDMALAGGVAITFPQKRGYLYQEGGMGSEDGRCRPFDAGARGTVFGSGAGVVLLKRLEDAVAAGDHVCAVVRGFAVNNDGAGKVGYTAPSVDGQANVVATAHAVADVDPETITYLEAHGTATPLGDPIEFEALTRAFRARTGARGFCALGSVKANVGHLEAAAGVTGLINAVQALIHRQLPPAVGFEAANPNIDLANSPFYFNTRLCPWKESAAPRRAGVSSFGVGGTNAHVVIEEAPPEALASRRRDGQVLVLSARSAEALEQVTDRLAAHLKAHPDADLGSVAFTLQAGRRAFEYRRAVACADMADAVRVLENRTAGRVLSHVHNSRDASVVFMFPGQGSQYLNMGADPYRSDAPFRADVDWCCDVLAQHLHLDLRTALFADERAPHELTETWLSQPALFVIEYALARLWMRWGVRPRAMIGHSVGEFVAACLAGVFSPEDALAMVATRARLMQELPSGAMLSVRMGEDEAATLLNGELSLAAANGPRLSVVAGPVAAIAAFERKMAECGVPSRRLATSHAFHSRMMDPVIGPFTDYLRRFRFHAPKTPYVSGVSGAWVPAEEATDPGYWARHLREPVRFSKGVRLLQTLPAPFFLEVGPGHVLCTLARQHSEVPGESVAVASLPAASDGPPGRLALLNAAGALWLHGATPNWAETHGPRPRRCPLPTYPFERKRYWIDPPARGAASEERQTDDGATPAGAPRAQSKSEAVMPEPSPSDAGTPPRKVLLRTALIELFQELSGLTVAECDASATFLEMGFDSLFLTQVTQALQTKFGLRIAFRQLLDQESTVNALAAYLDARLPADQFRAAPAAPAVPPAVAAPAVGAAAIVAGPTAIETVVREQLQAMSQLMTRQLEILRGAGVAAPPAPGAAALAPKQEFKAYGRYKPVQRGPVGGLTERQARHLSELVRRYTAKTAQSKEMTQRRRPMLADPRVASGFRASGRRWSIPS